MPFVNYHSCRLKDPGKFKDGKDNWATVGRKSASKGGRTYLAVRGVLKATGKWADQALRYAKGKWPKAVAQSHCKAHKGILFEPAKGTSAPGDPDEVAEVLAVGWYGPRDVSAAEPCPTCMDDEAIDAHDLGVGLEDGATPAIGHVAAGGTVELPTEALCLAAGDKSIELAADDGDGGSTQFKMLAYSGYPVVGHWYYGTLVLDCAGMVFDGAKMAVLREHERNRIVGLAPTRDIEHDTALVVTGKVLDTGDGREILSLSKQGFPWQASMYFRPLGDVIQLAKGETMTVNGHPVRGPAYVFTKTRIREVSFCTLGADHRTRARAWAAADDGPAAITVQSSKPDEEHEPMAEPPTPGAEAPPAADLSKVTAEQLRSANPDLAAELAKAPAGTVEELKAAMPDAPADFLLEQVQAGASVADARGNWADKVLKEKAAAAEADATTTSPVETAGDGTGAEDVPKTFRQAVALIQKERADEGRPVSRSKAMSLVDGRWPDLRRKMVAAANPTKKAVVDGHFAAADASELPHARRAANTPGG